MHRRTACLKVDNIVEAVRRGVLSDALGRREGGGGEERLGLDG